MPSLTTIRGLTPAARAMIESLIDVTYLIEPVYHPSVEGCWFQVYNPVTEDIMIIDMSTTVGELQQILSR